jgi:hypothetical protein
VAALSLKEEKEGGCHALREEVEVVVVEEEGQRLVVVLCVRKKKKKQKTRLGQCWRGCGQK